MAEKTVKSRIQVKRGTSAQWKEAGDKGFTPKEGEIIFYSDLNKIKIGDGKTIVDSKVAGTTVLPFLHVDKSEIDSWVHAHDDRYYTESEVDTKLATKSDTGHTHNYAGSSSAGGPANSVKASLTFNNSGSGVASGTTYNGSTARTISYNTVGAAAASHTHTKSQITDFAHNHDDRYYTESESDARYAPISHNQASNTINAMTGYSKASSASAITTTDTLNTAIGKLEKALDGKGTSNLTLGTTSTTAAKGDHTHDDRYYTESEIDTKLATLSKSYTAGEGISISEDGVISISFLHAEDQTF